MAGRVGIFCRLVSGLFLSGSIYGQKGFNLDKILPQLMEKGESDSSYIIDNYSHEELEFTSHLKNGVVTETEEKKYFVEKRGGILARKLMSRDGGEATGSGSFEPKKEALTINAKLFQRYIFEFQKNEIVAGKKYWVLSFRPRNNYPEIEKKDRVLNNLSGKVWIDQHTMSFKKLEARLSKSIDFYAPGILGGRVTKLEATTEADLIDGCAAVSQVNVELKYSETKIPFWSKNKHLIIHISYQNYQRRAL